MTIGQRYDAAANGLTGVRVLLAAFVLITHAWALGGFGRDPLMLLTGARMDQSGTLAVLGFFGISGFLLVDSRERTGTVRFIWKRSLRILPGLWVLSLLTAVFVGPAYLVATLPIVDAGAAVAPVLSSNPGTALVNGSLWTLWPECLCYLAVAIVPPRAARTLVPLAALVLPAYVIANHGDASFGRLFEAFAFGALFARYRERIPLTGILAAVAVVATCATVDTVAGTVLAPPAVAYAVLWLGARLRAHWPTDISYGLYIYGFPITQALIVLGAAGLGPVGLAATALLVTFPFSIGSWFLVERRALRFKDVPVDIDRVRVPAMPRLRSAWIAWHGGHALGRTNG